ncbi:MAG: hypothetical protein IKG18_10045 [Atopobiaceae bacterium]|nr:hypothetical protein [Atopobiaceae bacterium]
MSDSRRNTEEKDERRRDLRLSMPDEKPPAAQEGRISVDAYSLASQRRAIAYGRARGRS